jgi:hypothetical protein
MSGYAGVMGEVTELARNEMDAWLHGTEPSMRDSELVRAQLFGHRYWFYLKDAVEDVPEYIVHWQNFEQ